MRSPPKAPSNSAVRLVFIVLILPLLLALVGGWEFTRARNDAVALPRAAAQMRIDADTIEARGKTDSSISVQLDGSNMLYGAAYGAELMRDRAWQLAFSGQLAWVRQGLAVVVVIGGIVGLLAGALGLALALWADLVARRSREAMAWAFLAIRPLFPGIMAGQAAGFSCGVGAAMLFECLGASTQTFDDVRGLALAGMAGLFGLGAIWLALMTVRQLLRALPVFNGAPDMLFAREVDTQSASALWSLVSEVAERLDAPTPDHIVVGLQGAFFVSSQPWRLLPAGPEIGGRTLYLSLPLLGFLGHNEIAAVIAHELAHFSGKDNEFSSRVLPIYQSFQRGLLALLGGRAALPLPLSAPAMNTGRLLMRRFQLSVRRWSRERELAADQASLKIVSRQEAASALLRTQLATRLIEPGLREAMQRPRLAPPDLVRAILAFGVNGLGDPAPLLAESQAHPTDSHPSTEQRLEGFGIAAGPALFATASRAPDADSGRMAFADWPALCGTLSGDYLAAALARDAAEDAALAASIAKAGVSPVEIFEKTTRRAVSLTLMGFVWFGIAGYVVVIFTQTALWISPDAPRYFLAIAGVAAVLGIGFFVGACRFWRGRRTPFLVLTPETVTVRGLERVLRWSDIADIMVTSGYSLNTVVVLRHEVGLRRRWRGVRLKLDKGGKTLRLRGYEPAGLTLAAYRHLLADYLNAARAQAYQAGKSAAAASAGAHKTAQ